MGTKPTSLQVRARCGHNGSRLIWPTGELLMTPRLVLDAAERDWETRALVRLRRASVGLSTTAVVEAVQAGEAGTMVKRDFWRTADGATLDAGIVEVLVVLHDDPPEYANAGQPVAQVAAMVGSHAAEAWLAEGVAVVRRGPEYELARGGGLVGVLRPDPERGWRYGVFLGFDRDDPWIDHTAPLPDGSVPLDPTAVCRRARTCMLWSPYWRAPAPLTFVRARRVQPGAVVWHESMASRPRPPYVPQIYPCEITEVEPADNGSHQAISWQVQSRPGRPTDSGMAVLPADELLVENPKEG